MAFFMLMWLLNATTEKQRKGIADYFNPTIPVNRISGGGEGSFGGTNILLTNDLLEAMMDQLGSAGLSSLASWVGMEVRAPGPAMFDGSPLELSLDPAPEATARVLVVENADGATVQRLTVPPGETVFDWAGVSDAGTPMPDGAYSFSLETYDGETLLASTPVPVYAEVTEARIEEGGTVLVTAAGTVAADDVTAIRHPR